jgi:hypothetical protein
MINFIINISTDPFVLEGSNEEVIMKGQGPNRRSRSGTVGQKNREISDGVGFRLRISGQKQNYFYLTPLSTSKIELSTLNIKQIF